jgi:hypothetical protein
MTMLLGVFDIAATFQEQVPVIPTLRHRHYHRRGPAYTGLPLRGQISRPGLDRAPSSCVGN